MRRSFAIITGLVAAACSTGGSGTVGVTTDRFASDLAFLQQHTPIVVLSDGSGARVAVAPAYQGRVMTSTTGADGGPSFGWIGRAAVESGQRQPHMNVFGGEDRFWLGPEGGRFALYFKPGDPFDLDHWQTPEPFDWGAWDVAAQSSTEVTLGKRMSLVNYAGTRFVLDVERTVRLLPSRDVARQLGAPAGSGLRMVAFESSNTVVNAGPAAWRPDGGLLSIWILGQFTPSPRTTIAIPFTPGPEATAGPVVNDAYFGPVPPDHLIVREPALFFRGDGRRRGKIGLPPARALDVAGSYDAGSRVLTLVQCTRPAGALPYVNSMWDQAADPYRGDVINSYNDGPPAPGKPPLGPFYEIETSSPALALAPGERYTHVQRTIHVSGPEPEMDRVARGALKVGLAEISSAFPAH